MDDANGTAIAPVDATTDRGLDRSPPAPTPPPVHSGTTGASDGGATANPVPPSLTELLQRVTHLEQEAPKSEDRWHTRLGTFAGIMGLVLSLTLAARTVYNEVVADNWRLQTELTEVVSKLLDLNVKAMDLTVKLAASPSGGSAGMDQMREMMRPIANQRIILLEEAKRIVASLGEDAPVLELSVLAESYTNQLDYGTAEAYLRKVADQSDQAAVAAAARRSLGTLGFIKGAAFRPEARGEFQRAADLLANRSDLGAILGSLDVLQVWAETELANGEIEQGIDATARAQVVCSELPCFPTRGTCAAWAAQSYQRAASLDPRAAILSAAASARALAAATRARQRCGDTLDLLAAPNEATAATQSP